MGTIYDVTYRENLHRVTDQTTTHKPRSKSDNAFARVLSDYDKSSEKSKDINTFESKAAEQRIAPGKWNAQQNILTNLNQAERRTLDLPTEKVLSGKPEPSVRPQAEAEAGVKSPSKPVKRIALQAYNQVQSPRYRLSRPVEEPPEIKEPVKAAEPIKIDKEGINKVITAAGKFHGVDPLLSMAVAKAESAYDVKAISSDGHASKGLFQLLDTTAKDMITRLEVQDQYDPFDAGMNSHLGVGYLRYLLDSFSTRTELSRGLTTFKAKTAADLEKLAVAAFNAGEGNVARAQAQAAKLGTDAGQFLAVEKYLPAITRDYVARVSAYKQDMESREALGTNSAR